VPPGPETRKPPEGGFRAGRAQFVGGGLLPQQDLRGRGQDGGGVDHHVPHEEDPLLRDAFVPQVPRARL